MATPRKRSSAGQRALELAERRADVIDKVGKTQEAIGQLREKHAREMAAAEQAYVEAVADASEQWSPSELRDEFGIQTTKAVREEKKRRKAASVPTMRPLDPVEDGGDAPSVEGDSATVES